MEHTRAFPYFRSNHKQGGGVGGVGGNIQKERPLLLSFSSQVRERKKVHPLIVVAHWLSFSHFGRDKRQSTRSRVQTCVTMRLIVLLDLLEVACARWCVPLTFMNARREGFLVE